MGPRHKQRRPFFWKSTIKTVTGLNVETRAYLGGHFAMPPPPLILPFSKKEQNKWCQVTKICQALLISVVYGQGGRMMGTHPPISHFQKCFNVNNFSVISNLFHSIKPCAFSTYIENVRTKCIGEALRIRIKTFTQNLRENYSKSSKIIIPACKFSKIFRGSMPPAL